MPTIDQKHRDCDNEPSSMRLDKLLYYLRFVKSRSIAQALCESGYMRLDGQRIEHGHTQAQIGSIITMPRGNDVIVFELLHIPNRRGPAREAVGHYNLINI